ncbi:glycosyltransferase family 2 protein [Candidatus Gottesmanbacteria bacterium]|nr:glycosyltransferase family 2 protein [Candidatus Gottesmanbacteria bacterium]
MKIVIILPTYNEVENIGPLVKKLQEIFLKVPSCQFTILVVDDFSPDGTSNKVEELKAKYGNICLLQGKKEGLGKALLRGINYALNELKADLFFQMDADLSHDPSLIPQFLQKIEQGADFVIGSRYIPGGSIPSNWGLHRKIFSIFGNLIVRMGLGIFSIHDWTSGYRAIKKEVFQKVNEGLDKFSGYTFQVAFLDRAKKAGFKVAEVPINFTDRKFGHSKIAPFDYIKNVLLYVVANSTFFKYVIVGILGFTINAIALEFFYRLGANPGIAAALGAELAIISNFYLNNIWTFAHKKITNFAKLTVKFIQFNLTSVGAIVIEGVVVGIGTWIFGDQTRFFFFTFSVIFLVIPYNFFVYNRFIWRTHER